MCGLFGISSSTLSPNEIESLFFMSLVSTFRGSDSSGLATIHRKAKSRNEYVSRIVKSTRIAPSLMLSSEAGQLFNEGGMSAVLAHCRAATIGEVTTKNAHPFRVKHIIGAHNGTVSGLTEKDDDRTDSEMIFNSIANKGLNETLEIIKNGAYALTWINLSDNTLNFIRNDKRPLYFMNASSGAFLWCSERWMLEQVAERMRWQTAVQSIVSLPTDVHVSLPIGSIKFSLPTPPKSKEVQQSPPAVINFPSAVSVSVQLCEEYPYKKVSVGKDTGGHSRQTKFVGPNGTAVEIANVSKLLSNGCQGCSHIADHRDIVWWFTPKGPGSPLYLCQDCNDDSIGELLGARKEDMVKGEIVNVN